MKYYKSLTTDNKGPYSSYDFTPYLPQGGDPRPWLPSVTILNMCSSGWHCVDVDHLIDWLNDNIYEVEIGGEKILADNKICAQQMRLLRKCEGWNERTARLFACDCADHVLMLFEAKHPDDKRPREAIETARKFANGEATKVELAAAFAAADAAAADPAALAGPASAQEPAPPAAPRPADAPLTIAVRDIRPFAYPTDKGWRGYSIEMWEDAAAELEVDYTYVEVPTVADQIDSVVSGRTQAALGAISITAERSEVVEFTQPMYDSGLQILVRSEGDDDGLFGVLAGLFSKTFLFLLVGLGILLVVVGHIIWLVERRRNDDHFPRGYFPGVWEGIWWAMVTMATVGYGDRVARTRMGRVVSMLWMLAGLVLVAQFTALVTSTLTVDRIEQVSR